MTPYYLATLYKLVRDDEFVWSDIKHKCRKGIRYFSERDYIEKTGRTRDGTHIWKIKQRYLETLQ